MTTPDPTLAARLEKLRCTNTDQYIREITRIYASGQLITLADHTAAVEKAVEAERRECADVARRLRDQWRCANGFEGFATGAKIIDEAIRARKGGAL